MEDVVNLPMRRQFYFECGVRDCFDDRKRSISSWR